MELVCIGEKVNKIHFCTGFFLKDHRFFLFLLLVICIGMVYPTVVFGKNSSEQALQNLISTGCISFTEINRETCGFADAILTNQEILKKYVSISVNQISDDRLKKISNLAEKREVDFSFWRINDSYIEIEPTDLLLFSSLMNYHHVSHVLNHFAKNVRKYICIPHMYKEGVPHEREEEYAGDYLEYPDPMRQMDRQGAWRAVGDFLNSHPEWIYTAMQQENNMLVLFRIDEPAPHLEGHLPSEVEFYLNHKIILCTGPSFGRFQMLKDTIESEMRLIPYKKIFIRTNDDKNMKISFSEVRLDCKKIPRIEKYVDCWNCMMTSLRDVANDPEISDDDIVLFKHESVFLNDLALFKRAIHKMLAGYDMIVRTYFGGSTSDIFLVRVSAIREFIHDFTVLSHIPDNQYVEMMLHTRIVNNMPCVYCIHLGQAPFASENISTWGCNGFGFYHYHNYFRFSNGYHEFVDLFNQ